MFRKTLFALATTLLALPALAQDAPLATYTSANDFPGDSAHVVDVTISTSGNLVAKRCPPGGVPDAQCLIRTAVVAQPELDAIVAATKASGLLTSPAKGNQDPFTVPTGSLTGGAVWLDGTYIHLPSFTSTKMDAERIAPVLNAIKAAIPQDLRDVVFTPLPG